MIKNNYFLSISAFLFALLLFAYQKEYIIFNFSKLPQTTIKTTTQKKNVSFTFWHQNQWHTEIIPILYSDCLTSTMQQLINRWLQLVEEEKVLKKAVILQAVLVSFDKQVLFISLNRFPWNKESTTFDKWMIIEGLLKTIQNSSSSIKKVHFLIDHQLMQDNHLDFTNPWPVDGFLDKSN